MVVMNLFLFFWGGGAKVCNLMNFFSKNEKKTKKKFLFLEIF
jgi:hypothetical protein